MRASAVGQAGLKTRLYVVLCAAIAAASPLVAHHSFAMFDTAKRVTMAGTVTAFEWTNPHAYIEVDVADEKGVVKHWSVELGSPSILMQGGWKFTDVKVGDKITVTLSPLRSGESGGLLSQITLRDGRVLGNGPGPTGGGGPR
jgi:hypothetical protein